MNRHVIVFLLLLTACINTKAQKNDFEAGLLFNVNRCIFHGDVNMFLNNNKFNKMHIGYLHTSEGLFVKRKFSEKLYGRMELRYISKGSVIVYSINSNTNENDWESLVLRYFEVPVMLGYKKQSKKNYVLFETGFAYSKLIDIKAAKSNLLTDNHNMPDLSTFKKYDISWIGSIVFPLNQRKKNNLFLGFRFSHSIFTINKMYKVYNSVYGLECEYVIKRKK
jgi:hypothetical protein